MKIDDLRMKMLEIIKEEDCIKSQRDEMRKTKNKEKEELEAKHQRELEII